MKIIYLFGLLCCLSFYACDAGSEKLAEGETISEADYELTEIPGTRAKRAVQRNAEGKVMQEGLIANSMREGTWVFYNEEKAFPVQMVSYLNGLYNGPYLEFNESGNITLSTFYVNNKLHGNWTKYRFARIESSAEYSMGELDGLFREYNFRDGKLKKEIYYKKGLQDGPMRFYDENENMTIEFIYKNGEKISGGSE